MPPQSLVIQVIQLHLLHQPEEGGWSITEAKWHYPELPQPLADGEGSLRFGLWSQLHLPVPSPEVKGAEPARPCDIVQGVVNLW